MSDGVRERGDVARPQGGLGVRKQRGWALHGRRRAHGIVALAAVLAAVLGIVACGGGGDGARPQGGRGVRKQRGGALQGRRRAQGTGALAAVLAAVLGIVACGGGDSGGGGGGGSSASSKPVTLKVGVIPIADVAPP